MVRYGDRERERGTIRYVSDLCVSKRVCECVSE